jgi:hypothetical protein
LIAIEGAGQIEHGGATYPAERGSVWLLPAMAGECSFRPNGEATILEIALPESIAATNGRGTGE